MKVSSRSHLIHILAAVMALLPLFARAQQTTSSFRVYVNNQAVTSTDPIELPPASTVTFTIRLLTATQAVSIDPTGTGEVVHTLSGSGPVLTFTTSYRVGSYEPRVWVGSEMQQLKLSIRNASASWSRELAAALGLIPVLLTWPVVAFIALLVLRPTLLKLIPRLSSVKVAGSELLIRDLEESLRRATDNTVRMLEEVFPPGKADKYMPEPAPDVEYYVHVAEFLDSINVPIRSSAVWNAIGAYYFIRDEEKSRHAFERSITLNPEDPAAYTTLGMWHLRLRRDLSAAQALFRKSVSLADRKNIDSPWAHVGLAAIARDLRDNAGLARELQIARSQFDRLVSRDATDYWAFHGLGWCSFHQAELSRAREEMEKALSLKPGFDAVNYNLACVHARLNNPASAVEALRKILGEKTKLERLGVPTEPDFLSMKSDEAFKEFLRAVGLVYQL